MEIKIDSSTVVISGNIKSVSDFQTIKNAIDSVIATSKSVTIEIPDSLSITSSVIGYLNKLVLKDKINLSMLIGNAQLIDLLGDLNLKSIFNVREIK